MTLTVGVVVVFGVDVDEASSALVLVAGVWGFVSVGDASLRNKQTDVNHNTRKDAGTNRTQKTEHRTQTQTTHTLTITLTQNLTS